MGFSEIIQVFNNDTAQQDAQKLFTQNCSAWFSYVQELGAFGVLLGGAPISALRLARCIVERTDFRGKVSLIGKGDGLEKHLPFFQPTGEFTFRDGTLSCKMELVAEQPADLDLIVGRSETMWDTQKLPCRYFFEVAPYGETKWSFSQFSSGAEQPQRITYIFEHMLWERPYALLPLYRDPACLKSVAAPIREHWKKHYPQAEDCEKLVAVCQSTLVLPVEQGSEASLLLLGLAVLRAVPANKVAVLADFSGSSCRVLRMFAEQPQEKWLDLLAEQFPATTRENLKRGLVTPLSSIRAAMAGKDKNLHFPESLSKTKVQPGHVYVCALKDAPADYRDSVYAQAQLPAFCAELETACVSMCAGLPYLCTRQEAFPAAHGAAGALRLFRLAQPLANDISQYLNAADLELGREVADLGALFGEAISGTDTDAMRYYRMCGIFAASEQNRRLEQGAALAYALTMRPALQLVAPQNDAQQELEELHRRLTASIEDGRLALSHAMPKSRAARYLDSLSENGTLWLEVKAEAITLDREQDISCEHGREDDPGDIVSVSVAGAKTCIGGTEFLLRIVFQEDDGPLMASVYGRAPGTFTLDGMPWLQLLNVGFVLMLHEDGQPVSARLEGDVKDTGLHVFMTMGADGSHRMQGSFDVPLTAMDAFYALAGGVDFGKALPPELQTLGGIGLESVALQLDAENSITQMEFTLTTQQPWTLWQRGGTPLITLVPRLNLAITSPMDLRGRQIWVRVEGDCTFGDAGTLRLLGTYPPFALGMTLLPPFSIGALLRMFDVEPPFEADITTLDVFASSSRHLCLLRAVVEGDWRICEQFALTGLGLELISRDNSFSIAFSGLMRICTLQAGVCVRYAAGAGWDLLAKVDSGGNLTMSDLVETYGGNTVTLTGIGENNPLLGSITARYAAGGDWSVIAAAVGWKISFLHMTVDAAATVGRQAGMFRCSLDANLYWNSIELSVGYSYLQGQNSFYFSWGKFSGQVVNNVGSLTIRDFSLVDIVSEMVGWVTGTPFGLEAPWDILNSIRLSEFTLTYNFESKEVSMQVKAELDLGFARVTGVKLVYGVPKGGTKKEAQVTLLGTFPWNTGADALGDAGTLGPWDAATPGASPVPDGKGNAYFDLRLLALGQRASLFGAPPLTVEQAVTALERYDPESIPDYDASVGWIVGAEFGLLRDSASKAYFMNAKLIFCDPALFGLHITLDSTAAKLFQGLSFDILYSKISDTIGLYKACVTLPNRMRYYSIGAYTLTLPCFSVEIYTNGDFKIDVGFPDKGDFSRSFAISGQFGPVPFVGAAGLYFGRLSSATAASSGIYLPQTGAGLFNPAVVFGIGLRLGIGKSLNAGILKAGFSLTFTAMIEGVFAKFNPYHGEETDWYYAVTGTAGIHGAIYGIIDFAIITASVDLAIAMEVSFALVAYRAATFTVSAYIRASASLTINLGLFKISISFHFFLHVQESFTVGKDALAPWDQACLLAVEYEPHTRMLDFAHLTSSGKITLPAQLSLALTAAADDGNAAGWDTRAVALMTLSPETFCILAQTAACWAVAAVLPGAVDEKTLCTQIVPENLLADLDCTLSSGVVLTWQDVDRFLTGFLSVVVEGEALMAQNGEADGVVFSLPPALLLTLEENGQPKSSYRLDEFSRISPKALVEMRREFDRLAVAVESEGKKLSRSGLANAPELSMAQWLMTDYFLLLARQSVKYLLTEAKNEQRPFGELLEALHTGGIWENLGGMASRYQLHGLRIPTEGITRGGGGVFPPELGIHALCGAQLCVTADSIVRFGVGSGCQWLTLPCQYSVAVDKSLVRSLGKWMNRGFFPALQVTPDKPEAIPLSISFARPFPLDAQTAWNVPESLPRDRGHFTLQRFTVREEDGFALKASDLIGFCHAALVEFTVKKTDVPNVYLIAGASEHCVALLAEVVQQTLPVMNCRLAGVKCLLLSVMQMDLSTETHPPAASNGPEIWALFLRTLWEAFITNNAGYALVVHPEQPFPESWFNDRGEGTLTLVITYDTARVPLESPAINAVLTDGWAGEETLLAAVADTAVSVVAPGAENTLSYINAGWSARRSSSGGRKYEDAGEELLDHTYTILRHSIENAGGFPASRGSMPAGPDESWRYHITVPVDTYLNQGDYGAAGKQLSIWLQWLDLYGNKLPEFAYHDYMHPTADCGYMDALLGFSRWPGVTAQWEVKSGKGLCVTLSFDGAACMRQKSAPAAYRRVAAQLGDPHGVELVLISPLYPGPVAFPKTDCSRLTAWVQAIRDSLNGAAAPGALEICFVLPVQADLQMLSALVCTVRLTRYGAPAKGFETVDNVRSVTSELTLPKELTQFARDFEAALPMLRVLKGREQLFALRSDRVSLHFPKGEAPAVFAPRPVSNTLHAESGVKLYRYESGKGLSDGTAMSYTGVDLNIWLKNTLAVVDTAFTPAVAGAMAALEKAVPGTVDYGAFLAGKRALAQRFSGLLEPVLAGQSRTGLKEARETFRQRLLSRLSNLYDVRAVVSAPAEVSGTIQNARLYGIFSASTAACDVTLSPAKIICNNGSTRCTFTLSGDELVRSQNGEMIPFADFTIQCRVTHLETEIQELADGFESSAWLQAVTGSVCSAGLESFSVPFPLYIFPEMPMMEEHGQVSAQEDSCCAYRFAFSNTVHYPQLQPQVTVLYNLSVKQCRRMAGESLFTVLARFNAVGAAIAVDLRTSAEEICAAPGLPDPRSAAATRFAAAAKSLLTLMQELSVSPFSYVRMKTEAGERLCFTLAEGSLGGALTVTVRAPDVPESDGARIVPEVGATDYVPVLVSSGAGSFTYVFEDIHKRRLSSVEGQLIKRRGVSLPPRKILAFRNACAEMFIEQNRFLIPGRESAPEFVFTTGTVSFPAPYAASAAVSTEKDVRIYLKKGAEDTLTNCLRALFAHYIGEASHVTVQAECRYRRETGGGLPIIEQPVFLQTPTAIERGDTAALMRGWVDTLTRWRGGFPALRREWLDTEGLRFSITFTDNGNPVMALENCIYHGKPVIR